MKAVILNFAYGFGPFLRTTELALKINDLLEKDGKSRLAIVVPLVYGAEQKRIMQEQFGHIIRRNPKEILLDESLGGFLDEIFYGKKSYEESLKYYLASYESVTERINDYIRGGLKTKNFAGKDVDINYSDIVFELSRAPRVKYDLKRAYYTGFGGYISEILEKAIEDENYDFSFGKELVKKLVPIYRKIEEQYSLHFMAEPGTFSYIKNRKPKFGTEISTPPNLDIALFERAPSQDAEEGVFVTITGIPGLENLFAQTNRLGLTIYANKSKDITNSRQASPNILRDDKIKLHFARSGWGSVWISLFLEKLFVTPAYQQGDDPEIYFNNKCIEELGLGIVYSGQRLEEIIGMADAIKQNYRALKEGLEKKYGTLDGVEYTARRILQHYLSSDN